MTRTIRARFSEQCGHWVAHFEDAAHIGAGGDMPVVAVRRLLDMTDSPAGDYRLECDQDMAGSDVLLRTIAWNPPALSFVCHECGGRGRYVGLIETEACRTCGGRGVLPT